jgi:hypothetical protein
LYWLPKCRAFAGAGFTGTSRFPGEVVSDGDVAGDVYPSHLRPVLVHLLQAGLASSHFTLRILRDR